MNLGDAVANLDHGADFHHGDADFKILDLLANDVVDFVCFNWFHRFVLCTWCFVLRIPKQRAWYSNQSTNYKPPTTTPRNSSHPLGPNLFQMIPHCAVVNGRADPRDDAAAQIR